MDANLKVTELCNFRVTRQRHTPVGRTGSVISLPCLESPISHERHGCSLADTEDVRTSRWNRDMHVSLRGK